MIGLAFLVGAIQTKSLLQEIGIRPTGQNGYEEYLQAAELTRSEEAKSFADWVPGQPFPGRPNFVVPLEVRREELRRFGRVLDLVARGNAKRVFDPRSSLGPDTLFPEFASFRQISRFATRASSVYAADGDTSRAAATLLDILVFADNGARGVLISNLVGAANSAVALGAFVDLLPRLSRPDAVRVQRVVDGLLARPLAIRETMAAEAAFGIAGIRQAFAKKNVKNVFVSDDEGGPDPRGKRWQRELETTSPSGRQRLLGVIQARIDARTRAMERIFAGPERTWYDRFEALDGMNEENPQDLADALMGQTTPIFSGSTNAAVRVRTQLRLLSLHARLVQYRWDHGRYPKSLDVTDPLTGEPYLYELHDDGTIRLASEGVPQTGEIELKYVRPAKDDHEVAP